MNSLPMKISELKKNLMDINIKAIKKNKNKPIKINSVNQEDIKLVNDYNYHVKLAKRIKKYMVINQACEIILKMKEDVFGKIICIAISVEKNKIDIGLPIDIKIISGNECNAVLNCSYYNNYYGGRLYLNDFRSSVPNKGYGGIILKNLDDIITWINKILINLHYEEIILLEGVMIPNKNIICEDNLRKLYLKYNFQIDTRNNIKRYVENKSKVMCSI